MPVSVSRRSHRAPAAKFASGLLLALALLPCSLPAQPQDLVPGTIAPVVPFAMARPQAEWLAQARKLERQGNWSELLELGRQWTQTESRNALAWFVRGRASSELQRQGEAIAAYRQALKIEPGDVHSINNLGNAYRDSGRVREAMQTWREALRINPGYVPAWHNIGLAFYVLKGQAGVVQALQRLQAVDPVLAEVWRKLAVDYAVTRDERLARDAVRVLRDLNEAQRARMFDILFAGL
jgi:tetratricopeptide (TPR) repeat protein